jgi:hypothetical protein
MRYFAPDLGWCKVVVTKNFNKKDKLECDWCKIEKKIEENFLYPNFHISTILNNLTTF